MLFSWWSRDQMKFTTPINFRMGITYAHTGPCQSMSDCQSPKSMRWKCIVSSRQWKSKRFQQQCSLPQKMEPLRALEQTFSVVVGREFRNCTIKVLRKVWVGVKIGDNGRHASWWFLGFHMASWVRYRVPQLLKAPSGIWVHAYLLWFSPAPC